MEWLSSLLRGLAKPLKWWIVIATWERGLRVRLGKTSTALEPGIHLRIPWLDRIYVQSVRLRTLSTEKINAMSKDGKNVSISVAVHFTIKDVKRLYDSLSTPSYTILATVAEHLISNASEIEARRLTAEKLEAALDEWEDWKRWGIGELTLSVTGFSVCRAYRLLQNEYQGGAGLWCLDGEDREGAGER